MFKLASLRYMQENPVKGVLLYTLTYLAGFLLGLILIPFILIWSVYFNIRQATGG